MSCHDMSCHDMSCHDMSCHDMYFYASRKVIKNFDSKIKGTFLNVANFAVEVCKAELNLVLIL